MDKSNAFNLEVRTPEVNQAGLNFRILWELRDKFNSYFAIADTLASLIGSYDQINRHDRDGLCNLLKLLRKEQIRIFDKTEQRIMQDFHYIIFRAEEILYRMQQGFPNHTYTDTEEIIKGLENYIRRMSAVNVPKEVELLNRLKAERSSG